MALCLRTSRLRQENAVWEKNLTIKASHNWFKLSSRKNHSRFIIYSALRSGITVASEVHPRRGYCWLKTFPNTPQDDLKYSRLCNFWRPFRGPFIKFEKENFDIITKRNFNDTLNPPFKPGMFFHFKHTFEEESRGAEGRGIRVI